MLLNRCNHARPWVLTFIDTRSTRLFKINNQKIKRLTKRKITGKIKRNANTENLNKNKLHKHFYINYVIVVLFSTSIWARTVVSRFKIKVYLMNENVVMADLASDALNSRRNSIYHRLMVMLVSWTVWVRRQ
jgi:hypothetical protein